MISATSVQKDSMASDSTSRLAVLIDADNAQPSITE